MGKKNRSKELKEESIQKLPTEPPSSDNLPDDEDEALIPLHTKQASFALLYLLFFSVLMFTLPFCAFYGMRYYLEKNFDLTLFEINCWSVLSAVVTVNIVIVMYIFKAFKEVKEESDTREAIRGKKVN